MMSLHAPLFYCVPEATARVAKAAFPQGNLYMRIRDELGPIYTNPDFAALFPSRGQPAEAPARLALVTVMQFVEGLSDRQAADAVRDRLAWKYALALELEDPGFDASILSEFRTRLIAGGAEYRLLDPMLTLLGDHGLLKARGKQRTDSTAVLAVIRTLNRLECVGETMRHALNDLARVTPEWLRAWVPAGWFDRYSRRVEDSRLPTSKADRQLLAEQIGTDGLTLLTALTSPATPPAARGLAAIQTLRLVWMQQFYAVPDGQARWRTADDLPPSAVMIRSPYDVEARFSIKRATEWVGYKVHVTEVCDADAPPIITHVETTRATTHDGQLTAPIHAALAAKQLLPATHIVDRSYADAPLVVESPQRYGIDLIGPIQLDSSWQAKVGEGFDLSHFQIDWDARTVVCPQGAPSVKWVESTGKYGVPVIHAEFSRPTCRVCPKRPSCTRSQSQPRNLIRLFAWFEEWPRESRRIPPFAALAPAG